MTDASKSNVCAGGDPAIAKGATPRSVPEKTPEIFRIAA
jgi:hypothetical protein